MTSNPSSFATTAPPWLEFEETWRAFQEFEKRYRRPVPAFDDLLELDRCLVQLAPFENQRTVHFLSVLCDGMIRDLRATNLDGDGEVEILAITDQPTVFCLKSPTPARTEWQVARASIDKPRTTTPFESSAHDP